VPTDAVWPSGRGESGSCVAQPSPPPPPPSCAELIKKPAQPLALRVCGHLLLGLSKIYQRQVAFLVHDSSEAFTRIKTVGGHRAGRVEGGGRMCSSPGMFTRPPPPTTTSCLSAGPAPWRRKDQH
jgi:hypothetical protein